MPPTTQQPFSNAYATRRVLITGVTGFKGSWLAIWLRELGATVYGLSAPPPTTPNNYTLTQLDSRITTTTADIRDYDAVLQTFIDIQPEIVFHLAAQPIVLTSYQQPRETFDTNTQGTVHVLDALRHTPSVRAGVFITTDKVYENQEWLYGYREDDRLGGYDPYSASKAMAELAIASYRQSFFNPAKYAEHGVAIASVRAGNVIGGGDFADFRLVPDCMRALMAGQPIGVRNPAFVRPWQHVLEALSGYLWLGANLLTHGADYADAYNLGPLEVEGITAQQIAEKSIELWGSGTWTHLDPTAPRPKETYQLRLSWEKAAHKLGWYPVYTWEDALAEVVAYFKAYQLQHSDPTQPTDLYPTCAAHIAAYTAHAAHKGLTWAG